MNQFTQKHFNVTKKIIRMLAYINFRSRKMSLEIAIREASSIFGIKITEVRRYQKLCDANSSYFDKEIKRLVEVKASSNKNQWYRLINKVKHVSKIPKLKTIIKQLSELLPRRRKIQ